MATKDFVALLEEQQQDITAWSQASPSSRAGYIEYLLTYEPRGVEDRPLGPRQFLAHEQLLGDDQLPWSTLLNERRLAVMLERAKPINTGRR